MTGQSIMDANLHEAKTKDELIEILVAARKHEYTFGWQDAQNGDKYDPQPLMLSVEKGYLEILIRGRILVLRSVFLVGHDRSYETGSFRLDRQLACAPTSCHPDPKVRKRLEDHSRAVAQRYQG